MVYINEAEKAAKVIVPDNQLSLAIGKEGQNARLAAKLTGWKIDIKSHSQAEADMELEMGSVERFPAAKAETICSMMTRHSESRGSTVLR